MTFKNYTLVRISWYILDGGGGPDRVLALRGQVPGTEHFERC